MRPELTRRRFLTATSLLPLAALVPEALAAARQTPASAAYRFFTPHQAAVLDAATRRLVPGPEDEPAEAGHPGAHEAGVLRYLDTMLSVFDFSPPKVFAGGPWSNRHASGPDHMASFVPLDPAQSHAWHRRITDLRRQYAAGVKLLDDQAGGDFTTLSADRQDSVLASSALAEFTALLFGHTIEGMYAAPEYGGNAGLAGWREIAYPGDSQPRGYTAAELAEQQVSVVDPVGITAQVLDNFELVARALAAGGRRRVP